MEKLKELLGKARKYLGIALNFLKKLVGLGNKVDDALEDAEDSLKEEDKK